MIVKIGGQVVGQYENGVNIMPIEVKAIEPREIDLKVDRLFKNQVMPFAVGTGVLSMSGKVFAATATGVNIADRIMPLINMIQDLALPVGIGVATWGLIEIIVGNFSSGKGKIKYAVVGFAGMFIIPEVFYAIRGAFQA